MVVEIENTKKPAVEIESVMKPPLGVVTWIFVVLARLLSIYSVIMMIVTIFMEPGVAKDMAWLHAVGGYLIAFTVTHSIRVDRLERANGWSK